MSVLENSYKERSNEEDDTRTDIAYGRAPEREYGGGHWHFRFCGFGYFLDRFFGFCAKRLFRFSWKIIAEIIVENNSGFLVLLSNVVCIRFWPNFLAVLDDFLRFLIYPNVPLNMELNATHFELSALLSRSVAYQGMKCFAECKMAASYVSEIKRQLIVHLLSTKKSRNCSNWWYKHETFTDCKGPKGNTF